LRAAKSLAWPWRDQGKHTAAHELLAPIYGWFTEGFATKDLKEAEALLAELADSSAGPASEGLTGGRRKPCLSHAREGTRLPRHPTPATYSGMAGSPMRRLRKTGALDPTTGELVVIPRLPPVAGASKPPGWNRWSEVEKVQHLLALSLDRMHEYLSWPADGLDPYRLAAQTQVIRVLAMVAAKDGMRQVDPEAAEAARRFRQAMLDDIRKVDQP
jgi:hypothetical protein